LKIEIGNEEKSNTNETPPLRKNRTSNQVKSTKRKKTKNKRISKNIGMKYYKP
jgi:hypothetical protein